MCYSGIFYFKGEKEMSENICIQILRDCIKVLQEEVEHLQSPEIASQIKMLERVLDRVEEKYFSEN